MVNFENFPNKTPPEESNEPEPEPKKEWWEEKEDITFIDQRKIDSWDERYDKWSEDNIALRAELNEELERCYRVEDACREKGYGFPKNISDRLKIAEERWKDMEEKEEAFRKEIAEIREKIISRKNQRELNKLSEELSGK